MRGKSTTTAMKNISLSTYKQSPAGGDVVSIDSNGKEIPLGTAEHGGMAKGQRHKEANGGIDGHVGGQPLKFETGEVIITRPAVNDTTKREFEGKMMTNKEILSKINSEAGGVSFADGGEVPEYIRTTGKQYNLGGKMTADHNIVRQCGCKHQHAHDENSAAYSKKKNAEGKMSFKEFQEKFPTVYGYKNKEGVKEFQLSVPVDYGYHTFYSTASTPHEAIRDIYSQYQNYSFKAGGAVHDAVKHNSKRAKSLAKTKSSLVVICKSNGNIDYDQDPYRSISPLRPVAVNSLKEAAEVCRKYIETFNLGGGNWTGGQVYDITGKQVAYVSYNGRVWDKDAAYTDDFKANEITGEDLTREWYAKGGLTKNKKTQINTAIGHLLVYKFKHKPTQAGYTSTQRVIDSLKANPTDHDALTEAILYLKASLEVNSIANKDSVKKSISELESIRDKNFARGGTVKERMMNWAYDIIPTLFEKYLPGVEPQEVFSSPYRKGQFRIDEDTSGDGAKQVVIEICFDDEKYPNAAAVLSTTYDVFAKDAENLAKQKGYNVEILSNDHYQVITFVFTDPKSAKYEKGGPLLSDEVELNEGEEGMFQGHEIRIKQIVPGKFAVIVDLDEDGKEIVTTTRKENLSKLRAYIAKFEKGGQVNEEKIMNGLSELTPNSPSLYFTAQMAARKLARRVFDKDNPRLQEMLDGIQEAVDKDFLFVTKEQGHYVVRPTLKLSDLYFENGGETQIQKGIKAETHEHAQTLAKLYDHQIDEKQAIEEIVKDHLSEKPDYYNHYADGGTTESKFTFKSSNAMQQGKALAALSKKINSGGKIMPIYEWIEGFPKDLEVDRKAKIHSSKSDKGYRERITIGNHIVDTAAEVDYYEYLQAGGYPYSKYLADKKAIEDKQREEARIKREAELKKSTESAKAKQNEDRVFVLTHSLEEVKEKYLGPLKKRIEHLRSQKQTKDIIQQLQVEENNYPTLEKSVEKKYNIIRSVYSLVNGEAVPSFKYSEGDKVIVDDRGTSKEAEIEAIKYITTDGSPTYKLKGAEFINPYFGYESLRPAGFQSDEAKSKYETRKFGNIEVQVIPSGPQNVVNSQSHVKFEDWTECREVLKMAELEKRYEPFNLTGDNHSPDGVYAKKQNGTILTLGVLEAEYRMANEKGPLKLSDIPKEVKLFMPEMQQKAIVGSEEHYETLDELKTIIDKMPKTYQTDGIPADEKMVWLHYFYGNSDWYIVEKDMGSPNDSEEDKGKQHQAFGYAILNDDMQNAEWGYISIEELKQTNRVELDFYFTPVKFGELKKEWMTDDEEEVEDYVADMQQKQNDEIEQKVNEYISEIKSAFPLPAPIELAPYQKRKHLDNIENNLVSEDALMLAEYSGSDLLMEAASYLVMEHTRLGSITPALQNLQKQLTDSMMIVEPEEKPKETEQPVEQPSLREEGKDYKNASPKLALKIFVDMLQQKVTEYYTKQTPALMPPKAEKPYVQSIVKVKPGRKYVNVDIGTSGKFMFDTENYHLYFIKGYGTIDRKKDFGDLRDIITYDFAFDGYSIISLDQFEKGQRSAYGYAGPIEPKKEFKPSDLTKDRSAVIPKKQERSYLDMELNEDGKIKVALIKFKDSEERPLGTFTDFESADKALKTLITTGKYSDIYYSIEWTDGEKYEGSIDVEPAMHWKPIKKPLSYHINTFYPNVATTDKYPYKGTDDQKFFRNLVLKYDLGNPIREDGAAIFSYIVRDKLGLGPITGKNAVETHNKITPAVSMVPQEYKNYMIVPVNETIPYQVQGPGGVILFKADTMEDAKDWVDSRTVNMDETIAKIKKQLEPLWATQAFKDELAKDLFFSGGLENFKGATLDETIENISDALINAKDNTGDKYKYKTYSDIAKIIHGEFKKEEGVIGYTTAEPAYDYSGVTTIEETEYTGHNGKPVRKVFIPKQTATNQIARYGSGLHPFFEEDEWNKVKDLNFKKPETFGTFAGNVPAQTMADAYKENERVDLSFLRNGHPYPKLVVDDAVMQLISIKAGELFSKDFKTWYRCIKNSLPGEAQNGKPPHKSVLEKLELRPDATEEDIRNAVTKFYYVPDKIIRTANDLTIDQRISAARERGKEAFNLGLTATPAHDPELMKLLEGLQVGQGGNQIMKAWSDAWHKENLSNGREVMNKPKPLSDEEYMDEEDKIEAKLEEDYEQAAEKEFQNQAQSQSGAISYSDTYKNASQTVVNDAIRKLLKEKATDREKYSADELAFIKRYEGAGAEKKTSSDVRILDQFFTPIDICGKMWGLAFKHGFKWKEANVLEPAVGSGRFLQFIPAGALQQGVYVRAYDVDETCYTLNKVLFPQFDIRLNSFETEFFKGNRHVGLAGVDRFYDLVIGNPPYREYVSKYAPLGEKAATGAFTMESYFIMRGVDVLKPGGLLIYIIPSTFLSNDSKYNELKEKLAAKCELIDAYRLPSGVFNDTEVTTDIIVLRRN